MGTTTPIQVISSATVATLPAINVGDAVNSAVRVNVVAGGGGGGGNVVITGPIGQTTMSASVAVAIASDQSAVTVAQATAANLKAQVVGAGTAGTANAGVMTIQGIASMTPVQVSQATASTLNATVIGAGTAGTANAGVMTIQGIASMTPVNDNLTQVGGSSISLGQTTMANSVPVTIASNQSAITVTASQSANLQASPITLFDAASNQAGATQQGFLFPHTVAITTGLPTIGSGTGNTLTNSSNVCGSVFSGLTSWAGALMQFAGVGGTGGASTITVEIGRLCASGAMAEALASVVLTASSTLTIGPTTVNPLTGATGHSNVTWVLFDVTSITNYSQLGDVLQAVGGIAGQPSVLNINVSSESYYYVVITALSAAWSEVLCAITPTT
jgi:hypothetical protein